jgi:membrane protease YdiL (CAAX protease family)
MREKTKQIIEILCVYIFITLLTLFFWMVVPKLSVVPRILAMFLFYIVMCTIPILLSKVNKRPLSILGFCKDKFVQQVLVAICVLVVLLFLAVGIPLLFGTKLNEIIGDKITNVREVFFQLPFTIIFVGFGEEILFRGYFLERIKSITSSNIWAVIISSLLFGFWHYPSSHSLVQVIVTTAIGVLFAVARIRVKNCTTLSVGLAHGCYDATLVLLRFFRM